MSSLTNREARVRIGRILDAQMPNGAKRVIPYIINQIMHDLGINNPDLPDTRTEPEPNPLLGFQIISEMTADEMLEEALEFQRAQWRLASKNHLKKFVIEARAHQHKARLIAEAQLEPEGFGIFGGGVATDEH